MNSLLSLAPMDNTGDKFTSDTSKPSAFGEFFSQPFKGAFYGVGVAGAKGLMMANAGIVGLLPAPESFKERVQGEIFDDITRVNSYWGNSAGARTTAGNVMFSVGKSLGQFATYGWAGAGVVSGMERTMNEIDNGKTVGQAAMLGGLEGSINAIGGVLPFKIPLIGAAAWRTGVRAAVQRVGYGVASNVIPGMVQRGVEGAMLRDFGYAKEAEGVKVLDPTALLVDTIMGAALGGAAKIADVKAAATSMREAKAELMKAAETASPKDSVLINEQVKAIEIQEGINNTDALRLDLEGKAQEKVDLAEKSGNVDIATKLAEADNLDTKLRLIGEDALANQLGAMKSEIDPRLIDSAMVQNEVLNMQESAPGKLQNDAQAEKIVGQIEDMARAMDNGDKIETPNVKTLENPERLKYLNEKKAYLESEGAVGEVDSSTQRADDWSQQVQEPTTKNEVTTAAKNMIDRLPGDEIITFDDNGNSTKMTKAEFMARFEEEISHIDNEADAVSSLFSCMLR